jgi:hypothetical protein
MTGGAVEEIGTPLRCPSTTTNHDSTSPIAGPVTQEMVTCASITEQLVAKNTRESSVTGDAHASTVVFPPTGPKLD